MSKPNYDELKKRVKELEKSEARLKELDEELRKSKERYKLATQSARIGVWDWNIKTGDFYIDSILKEVLGYTDEEIPNDLNAWTGYVHPDDRKALMEAAQACLEGKTPEYVFEYRMLHKDGSIHWIFTRGNVIRNAHGEVVRMVGVDSDITERKKAEKEKERFLHDLGERVKELNCFYNISKLIEKPDISLEKIFQGTADLIPPSWQYPDITCARILYNSSEFKTKKFKTTKWKQSADIKSNGEIVGSVEVFYLEERQKLYEGSFLKEERNLIDSIALRLKKVIERKQAEDALKYRIELERIFSSISATFININLGEVDSGINHALKTIGEFVGIDRSYIFLFSDDMNFANNTHEWCAEGTEPQKENLQGISCDIMPWWMRKIKKSETIHIPRVSDLPPEANTEKKALQAQDIQSLIVVPMVYGGSLIGFLGFDSVQEEKTWKDEDILMLRTIGNIFADALEYKQMEKDRLLKERMQGVFEMAGAACHELNQPMQAVYGYSELLLMDLSENSPLSEKLTVIINQIERMGKITRKLQNITKYETKNYLEGKIIDIDKASKTDG